MGFFCDDKIIDSISAERVEVVRKLLSCHLAICLSVTVCDSCRPYLKKPLYTYLITFPDWSHIEKNVAQAIIQWVYTDEVDFSQPDDFTLSLMKNASQFRLDDLVNR